MPRCDRGKVLIAAGGGEPPGGMQDAVAVGVDRAAGQGRLVGEAEQLQPGDEVGGGEDELEPHPVLGAVTARQVHDKEPLLVAGRIVF